MYCSGIWITDDANDLVIEQLNNKQRTKWLRDNKIDQEGLILIINRLCDALNKYQQDELKEYELIKARAEDEQVRD